MRSKLTLVFGILGSVLLFVGTLYLLLRFFAVPSIAQQPAPLKKIIRGVKVRDQVLHQTFYSSPNLELEVELIRGTQTVYRQSYKTDEHLLRIPLRKMPDARAHAFFAGCSFVWGEGVKEEETLPARFQDLAPNYQAYNLGLSAGGLHSHLRYLELFPLKKVIKEAEGIYFYVFITHHLDRFFGRYNFVNIGPKDVPHYRIESGQLVNKGKFKEQPFYERFKEAEKLGLADALIRTQDPLIWSDDELREFALGIKFLKERYLEQFPKGEFFFVFHPLALIPTIATPLKRHLSEFKISVVDPLETFERFRGKAGLLRSELAIPDDHHPTAKGHLLFAQALVEDLRKGDQSSRSFVSPQTSTPAAETPVSGKSTGKEDRREQRRGSKRASR